MGHSCSTTTSRSQVYIHDRREVHLSSKLATATDYHPSSNSQRITFSLQLLEQTVMIDWRVASLRVRDNHRLYSLFGRLESGGQIDVQRWRNVCYHSVVEETKCMTGLTGFTESQRSTILLNLRQRHQRRDTRTGVSKPFKYSQILYRLSTDLNNAVHQA